MSDHMIILDMLSCHDTSYHMWRVCTCTHIKCCLRSSAYTDCGMPLIITVYSD